MNIQSRVFSEELDGRTVWHWQVWDADFATTDDGTPIFYGRSVCEDRDEAEARAEARVAEIPARDVARRAVGK
jgi:hypothetical protein